MLEKLGTKYLAVCENQGKMQPRVMKKKQGGDDAKKTKD